MEQKVVIEVSGGVVTTVYASHPIEIVVWDWDNKKEEGIDDATLEAQFVELTKGLHVMW